MSGGKEFTLDGRRILWSVSNLTAADIVIDGVAVSRPAANGKLKKIKLRGRDIYTVATGPPSAEVTTGWSGSTGDRRHCGE